MITEKYLYFYRVKHSHLRAEGHLVLAGSVKEAISVFMQYYAGDYDVREEDITSVKLEYTLEALMDVNI